MLKKYLNFILSTFEKGGAKPHNIFLYNLKLKLKLKLPQIGLFLSPISRFVTHFLIPYIGSLNRMQNRGAHISPTGADRGGQG